LLGIDGKTYLLDSFINSKTLVIVFMCNHCPYVQAVWQRLIALQNEFGQIGVQFIGINSNDDAAYPEDSLEKMQEYAAAKGQNFPYLRDEFQTAAKTFGAVCTPDIFVYDEKRQLAYHGRIDDNWQNQEKVERRELAEALKALSQGKKPSSLQHPSMGCSIKWKEAN
jgi:thiol-disulfide isomerase/thioredoxin